MKTTACVLALALGGAAALLAQDSTPPKPSPPATPAPSAIAVVEAVIATTVVDRVPQDTASVFPATVGQVVCWTKLTGAAGPETVHHVWFHGDTQVGDVELQVGGSPWRTWSRKSVPADWTGPWHVEIRNASGTMLKRVDFTIGAATTQ